MSEKLSAKTVLSLRIKLLVPLILLITLIFVLSFFGIRGYLRQTINGIMKEEIDAVIATTANCLNEDELQALTDSDVQYDAGSGWPQGMTDPRYWNQQACLDDIDLYNPRAEIYTYYAVDEQTLAYGLDQWATLLPEESYPFRETFTAEIDDDFDKLLLGLRETYYYPELRYAEEDDVYYFGATAPLKNSSGDVIGGLTVYLDASLMTESLNNLSNTLFLIFSGIYVLVGLLILLITRSATAQLTALKAASTRVANGDYTPISLKRQTFGDEVSTLAELFNVMLEKVRGTVEKLQSQLVELNFQIDHEKKNKEVKDIVETEYFKDLKTQAAELRKKRQQKQ